MHRELAFWLPRGEAQRRGWVGGGRDLVLGPGWSRVGVGRGWGEWHSVLGPPFVGYALLVSLSYPVLCLGGGGPSSLLGVAGYPVLCQPSLAVNMPESLALTLNLHALGRPDGWVVPSSSLGKGGTQFFAVGVVGVVPSSSLEGGVPSSSRGGGGGGTQFFAGEGGYPVLRWGRGGGYPVLRWGRGYPVLRWGKGVPSSSLGPPGGYPVLRWGGGYPVLRWGVGVPSSSLGRGGSQFFAGEGGYPVLLWGRVVPSSSLGKGGGYPVLRWGRRVPSSSRLGGGGGEEYPVFRWGREGTRSSRLGGGGYPVLRWGRGVPSSSLGKGGGPVLRWGRGRYPVLRWGMGGTQFFAGEGRYPFLRLRGAGGVGGYPVLCLPSLAVVLSVSLIALKTSENIPQSKAACEVRVAKPFGSSCLGGSGCLLETWTYTSVGHWFKTKRVRI